MKVGGMKPCPFCDETPSHPQPMAIHPNNECILNGVVATWEQWNTRPGEKAARVEGLIEAKHIAAEWAGRSYAADKTIEKIDKLIKAQWDHDNLTGL